MKDKLQTPSIPNTIEGKQILTMHRAYLSIAMPYELSSQSNLDLFLVLCASSNTPDRLIGKDISVDTPPLVATREIRRGTMIGIESRHIPQTTTDARNLLAELGLNLETDYNKPIVEGTTYEDAPGKNHWLEIDLKVYAIELAQPEQQSALTQSLQDRHLNPLWISVWDPQLKNAPALLKSALPAHEAKLFSMRMIERGCIPPVIGTTRLETDRSNPAVADLFKRRDDWFQQYKSL